MARPLQNRLQRNVRHDPWQILLLKYALSLAAVTAIAGCASGGSIFGGAPRPNNAAIATDTRATGDGNIDDYLNTMQALIEGDAFTRADVFRAAEDAVDYAPTTANRLRYALALAVPGHAGSDPQAAARRLRELVAASDALLPDERMLAEIQLRYVEHVIVLESNGIELQQRMEAAIADRDAVAAERIQILQSENSQLRSELSDATATLDAIMSIEESISEREVQ